MNSPTQNKKINKKSIPTEVGALAIAMACCGRRVDVTVV
jgi:hypothetical protein